MNNKFLKLTSGTIVIMIFAVTLLAFTQQTKLTVTSSAFKESGFIPAKYTCEGAEVSPPLNISGIPVGTKSLAIIIHDPDAPKAGGVTHWVIWNLPTDGNIPENFKGAKQGVNSDGKLCYKGMCPPSGTHHYNFFVYALDNMLDLQNSTDKDGLENAIQNHVLAKGELTGLYFKLNLK
jgi:Raf kinase inhibitor-like YbhB/YbcL family protein